MQGLKFDVNTKELLDAVQQLKALKSAVLDVNTQVSKLNKTSKENADVEAKATKSKKEGNAESNRAAKFLEQLSNKLKDITEGYSRSEAAVLKQARALKVTTDQFKQVENTLTKLRPLISDPFDSSIDSISAANKELTILKNRAELAAQGIAMSAKGLREYSRITDQIYAKTAGQSPNLNKSQILATPAFADELQRAKQEYINIQQQIKSYRDIEGTNAGGNVKKRALAFKEPLMDQHVLAMKEYDKLLASAEKRTNTLVRQAERRTAAIKASLAGIEEESRLASAGVSPSKAFAEGELTKFRQQTMGRYTPEQLANPKIKAAVDAEILAYDRLHNAQLKVGKSSKEMAFAMRQVPMQITDIAVSLAAGQPPLMVMLQQGGQLKDMFGGVKEAAVALATGLKDALIAAFRLIATPIGAAITLLGLFGASIYSAIDRAEEFNKRLILMGNTSKISLQEVSSSALAISSVTVTSLSKAGNSLIDMSKASGFTGASLKELTTTAILLEKSGGQSVEETAKAIAGLKNDPLDAMISLNKEIGFLTPNIVKQAYEFVNNGEKAKAAALLIREYSSAQSDLAKSLENNKGEFAKLFDWISGQLTLLFGRLGDLSLDILNKLAQPLLEVVGLVNKVKPAANPAWASNESLSIGKRAMGAASERATADAELRKWLASSGNNKKGAEANERASLKALLEKSGASQSVIDEVNSALAEKYKPSKEKTKDTPRELFDKYMYDDLNKELDAAKKRNELAKEQQGFIESILHDQQRLTKEQDEQLANRAALNQLSERDKFIFEAEVDARKEINRLIERVNDNKDLNANQKSALTKQLEAAGIASVNKAGTSAATYYDQQRDFATGWAKAYSAASDSARDYAKVAENMFNKVTDSMADAMTEFVMTGKLSFSSLADSIIKDLIRIQMKNIAVGLLGNGKSDSGIGGLLGGLVTAWLGGSGSSATATSGPSSATGMTGGWLGSGQSLNMNANGNAFGKSGVHYFANGGAFTNNIYNQPTPFKFANGDKFGIMGEAGPEAIMPLSRDSSGRLGVAMNDDNSNGGALSVVINNNGAAMNVTDQKETLDSRGNRKIELTVSELVSKEQSRPGSSIYNSTRNSFGLKPALVGR